MGDIDYKSKYQDLKQKFKDAIDISFRLGYEQGSQSAQLDAANQAQQAQQAQQDQMGQRMPGAYQGMPTQDENEETQAPEEQEGSSPSVSPSESELDQHISQLEGMLSKSGLTDEDMSCLRKSLDAIKLSADIRKGNIAVKSIAKSLNGSPKTFKLGKLASVNMTSEAKQAVSMQHKIVSDIMKSWENEEAGISKGITSILNKEGLTK